MKCLVALKATDYQRSTRNNLKLGKVVFCGNGGTGGGEFAEKRHLLVVLWGASEIDR